MKKDRNRKHGCISPNALAGRADCGSLPGTLLPVNRGVFATRCEVGADLVFIGQPGQAHEQDGSRLHGALPGC